MAFSGTAIKTFTLPRNITIVPYFTNCIQLTEIILHEGVTEIRSFRNTAIKSIDIPDGVTEIPKSAFADCASLREVRLPQNLKIINDGAFMNCTALEAIAFPETLTSFSYAEPVPFGHDIQGADGRIISQQVRHELIDFPDGVLAVVIQRRVNLDAIRPDFIIKPVMLFRHFVSHFPAFLFDGA